MKKNIFIIVGLLLFCGACDVNYQLDPNTPTIAPSYSIFNDAVKETVDDVYDEWFSGRFTLGTMQYWSQTEYTEEDRYQYRESMRENWEDLFINLENFRQVIDMNEDAEIKVQMSAYGKNENQVAASRIMIAWLFNLMADTWGDIPYWSYSTEDSDFQALQIRGELLKPVYAPQSKIYTDILKQLSEASDMIDENEPVFSQGDPLYGGDATKWKKFANSLRLRIAMKISGVDAAIANTHIADALSDGVFASNDDNAILTYEDNEKNGSPFQVAYSTRSDFAVTHSFMRLLNGDTGGFGVDPRREKYAQKNSLGNFVGVPNGADNDATVAFKWESLPGESIIGLNRDGSHEYTEGTQALMTYSEVEFLLSEHNSWNQTHYENGVRASMEQWGVDEADVASFVGSLSAANAANVMTQKYIALYMQGHTAWVEYRRTGFPQTLTMPGESFSITVDTGTGGVQSFDYTFTPIIAVTDIPYRMEYPQQESTLNGANYKTAVSRLSNGDEIDSKLWWDVN